VQFAHIWGERHGWYGLEGMDFETELSSLQVAEGTKTEMKFFFGLGVP
jgi:hypothetical protein